MGITKSDFFSEVENQQASILKALGHPARLAIVQHLLTVNSCICGDIVDVLPLSQPTISQHLKELKNVGLIKGSVEGNSVCYCLNTEKWQELAQFFGHFHQSLVEKNSSCC